MLARHERQSLAGTLKPKSRPAPLRFAVKKRLIVEISAAHGPEALFASRTGSKEGLLPEG